jgi:hypothetical protein
MASPTKDAGTVALPVMVVDEDEGDGGGCRAWMATRLRRSLGWGTSLHAGLARVFRRLRRALYHGCTSTARGGELLRLARLRRSSTSMVRKTG